MNACWDFDASSVQTRRVNALVVRALARILKLSVILEKVPVKNFNAARENQV